MTTDREALIKRLRKLADAIAKAGINGFGNECAFIADELEALSAQNGEQTDTVSVLRATLLEARNLLVTAQYDSEKTRQRMHNVARYFDSMLAAAQGENMVSNKSRKVLQENTKRFAPALKRLAENAPRQHLLTKDCWCRPKVISPTKVGPK